jgi:hypothetical protein
MVLLCYYLFDYFGKAFDFATAYFISILICYSSFSSRTSSSTESSSWSSGFPFLALIVLVAKVGESEVVNFPTVAAKEPSMTTGGKIIDEDRGSPS